MYIPIQFNSSACVLNLYNLGGHITIHDRILLNRKKKTLQPADITSKAIDPHEIASPKYCATFKRFSVKVSKIKICIFHCHPGESEYTQTKMFYSNAGSFFSYCNAPTCTKYKKKRVKSVTHHVWGDARRLRTRTKHITRRHWHNNIWYLILLDQEGTLLQAALSM